jgi:hypothetical protein
LVEHAILPGDVIGASRLKAEATPRRGLKTAPYKPFFSNLSV